MSSPEMIQVLRKHGALAYGQESDIERIADDWEDYDFTPAQADAWLEAGCFLASNARTMADSFVLPEQTRYVTEDGVGHYIASISYKFCNGDIDIDDVLSLVEDVA